MLLPDQAATTTGCCPSRQLPDGAPGGCHIRLRAWRCRWCRWLRSSRPCVLTQGTWGLRPGASGRACCETRKPAQRERPRQPQPLLADTQLCEQILRTDRMAEHGKAADNKGEVSPRAPSSWCKCWAMMGCINSAKQLRARQSSNEGTQGEGSQSWRRPSDGRPRARPGCTQSSSSPPRWRP